MNAGTWTLTGANAAFVPTMDGFTYCKGLRPYAA
jgi:hypothetical protein